jgi:hypothetical protein
MTQPTLNNPNQKAEDAMSKLVGALLVELAYDVPDKPGFESVRADLLAASAVYESGEKKDLVLRFYLAIRSLFHEIKILEKMEAARQREATAGSDTAQGAFHEPGINQGFPPPQ